MAVPRSRMLDLLKAQCRIFSHNYNPDNLRLGNKVLRQRLRGSALASYYPRKTVSFRDLQDAYSPLGMETHNVEEEDREESIVLKKMRGKGAPKKRRTIADSKSKKKKH